MKLKITLISLVAIGLIAVLIVPRLLSEEIVITKSIVPVKVETVEDLAYDEVLSYIGVITPDSIQTLGFKSAGKIEAINVEVGDKIDEETLLVTLDTQDLEFELRVSKSSLNAAKAQYDLAVKGTEAQDIELARLAVEKASQVTLFKATTLEDYTKLYAEGVISNKEFEGIELEATLAELDYLNAKVVYEKALDGLEQEAIDVYYSQYEQAKTNYEFKESLMSDSQLYATTKGTVIDILYEENELVPTGYPVVAIRKEEQVITLGINNEALIQLEKGQIVTITEDKREGTGVVSRIADVPDANTHLYEVEVTIDQKDLFLIGEIIKCNIMVGTNHGIMIPINSVVIDEDNYVYIVKDHKANKKKIEIITILDDAIIVKGIEEGEQLVTENVNKLYEGKEITIIGE